MKKSSQPAVSLRQSKQATAKPAPTMPPPPALPPGLPVPVTLHLSARQFAMLQEAAEHDGHASVEAAILDDLEGHIVSSAEILEVSEEEARRQWNGEPPAARGHGTEAAR